MQEKNDLITEDYSSIADMNLEIGNPGNAAIDYVNNELADPELVDLSAENLQPKEILDASAKPADATKSANAVAPGPETGQKGSKNTGEVNRWIRDQATVEQPYNSFGIEKHSSLLRQTTTDRDTAFKGSMTSFAIQRFLADMQNAERLSSSALRKRDDTGNNIFGKI